MIKAEGLMKKYGKRTVLKGVDIDVDRKEIVGLLGPNGAGKTTAFSLLLGLISSDGGSVFLDGVSLQGWPMYRRARAGIAFLPQESSIFRGLTVEENLLAVLETRREKGFSPHGAARQLMERFGLLALARQLSSTLSGGEKRRLEIARALALSPSYLFLDEPFTGIDPIAIGEIQTLLGELKKEGLGILVSDHNVRETLKITERAYIIMDGLVIRRGSPEELVRDPFIREKYLGRELKIEG